MRPRAAELVARGGVLVIAHRGASAAEPENTLPAFRAAVSLRADLVELDTHQSRDGIPMVIHDKDLVRTTNAKAVLKGSLLVADRTREEMQRLDAATWHNPLFRVQGVTVPTLAEALDVIQPDSMTLIERKAGDAKTMVDLLRAKGLLEHVVVQSFDWDFLADCRALAPELVLGALGSKRLDDARLAAARASGATVLGWNHKHVDQAFVERVQAAGLRLWVYTVNDGRRARQLADWGVNGIITNIPGILRRHVGGRAK